MQAIQINSYINAEAVLSVHLPKEWANKDVNVVLVLELLNQLKEMETKKENLTAAFDLLAEMPEDFTLQRQDDLPRTRFP